MPLSGWAVMVLRVTRPNRPLNGRLESFFRSNVDLGTHAILEFFDEFCSNTPRPLPPAQRAAATLCSHLFKTGLE
jgi:hypothetical protein